MEEVRKPLNILIIEDNPGDLFLLEEHLKLINLTNTVRHAGKIKEVKDMRATADIDLCFLDLTLPDSSGIGSFITLNKIIPYTPIIILSGLADMEVALEAISLGAQDYLIKGDYDEKLLTKSIQYSIERKKMLETLRQSNERYELVNKATNDTIWEWDLQKNTAFWGEGITRVFGYPKEEVTTDPDWGWNKVHPEEKDRVKHEVEEHIKLRSSHYQKDFRYRCSDGSFKNVYVKAHLLLDDNNSPVKLIGALVDVTEKVRLEGQLTEQKLLTQKRLTEETIQAQEKEREELGKELHDNVNQILASSKMYLSLGAANAGIREEMIIKSTVNINRAIEEIRKLTKALIVPSLGEIGLKELVTELINNISEASTINTRLDFNIPDETGLEKKLKLMLFRIIQEQCNNVMKHAHAKNLLLSIKQHQDKVILDIKDDGVGFDTKSKSNGIGLTNIKSRVDVYSGKMKIISSPGNGCHLLIEIPA